MILRKVYTQRKEKEMKSSKSKASRSKASGAPVKKILGHWSPLAVRGIREAPVTGKVWKRC